MGARWPARAVPFEVKAKRWDSAKHPRDRHGRFVHVHGKVRLADGTVGTVTAIAGGNVHVTSGGRTRVVAAHTVENVNSAARTARAPRTARAKAPAASAPVRYVVADPQGSRNIVPGKPFVAQDHLLGRVPHLNGDSGPLAYFATRAEANRWVREMNTADQAVPRGGLTRDDVMTLAKKHGLEVAAIRGPEGGEQIVLKSPHTGYGYNLRGINWTSWNQRTTTGTGQPLADADVDRYLSVYAANPGAHPQELLRRMREKQPRPGRRAAESAEAGDEPTARASTAESQRKKTAGLLDVEGQPAAVREAARLLAANKALTAQQATALAAAARSAAAGDGVTKSEARVLHRTADRLDAIPAHLNGIAHEHTPAHTGVTKTTVADLAEGDQVALPGPGGTADIRTVVSSKPWYKHHELVVQDAEGNTETRYLIPETAAYLLPDLPAPEPVKPKGPVREHIHPDQVRVGDVITYGDSPQARGIQMRVQSVTSSGGEVRIAYQERARDRETLQPTGDFTGPAYKQTLSSHSGLPSVIRLSRGPGSQDQSYDDVLPPDRPAEVTASELKIGDRAVFGSHTHGTVTAVTQRRGEREVAYRTDTGTTLTTTMRDTSPITRLAEGGDNAAARHAQLQQDANVRVAQRHLADQMRRIDTNVRMAAAKAAQHVLSVQAMSTRKMSDDEIASLVKSAVMKGEGVEVSGNVRDALTFFVPHIESSPATMQERLAIAERLSQVFTQVRDEARASAARDFAAAARHAEPIVDDPGRRPQSKAEAAYEVLSGYDYTRAAAEASDYGRAAQALARISPDLGHAVGAAGGPAGLPTIPEGADLPTRMAAYREALGPEFGKQVRRVQVFKQTSLADLQAGKVPGIETAEVPVAQRAADGGPGETAMAHLAIVRAAGADLAAELQRRMQAETARFEESKAARDREIEQIQDQTMDLLNRANDVGRAARQEFARLHGYDDMRQMRVALSTTDPAEWHRLSRLAREYGESKRAALDDQRAELGKRATQRLMQRGESYKALAEAQRKHAIAILAEVRKMGGPGLTYLNPKDRRELTDRSQPVQAMRWAESGYPADWLAHARGRTGGNVILKKVKRGSYNDATSTLALSEKPEYIPGAGRLGAVADHELGHRMERNVPGLLSAQEALLWDRTSTGPVGSRTRDHKAALGASMPGEMAYRDEFPDHYTGKDYYVGGSPYAFEVFTTAKEDLTGGAGQYLDDDLRNWTLGVLALLGHRGK